VRNNRPQSGALEANLEGPSRSSQRREALDVLALAKELCSFTETQLARLPLDESLREQIAMAKRITSHIAHKRQLQFLAKHMRDQDLSQLRESLSMETDARRRGSALHKFLEHWRDRMIAGGDPVLAEFLDANPQADRQGLRQALSKARKPDDPRHLVAARELFRKLRDAHVAQRGTDAADARSALDHSEDEDEI
jgi:ribosome-associated protein